MLRELKYLNDLLLLHREVEHRCVPEILFCLKIQFYVLQHFLKLCVTLRICHLLIGCHRLVLGALFIYDSQRVRNVF